MTDAKKDGEAKTVEKKAKKAPAALPGDKKIVKNVWTLEKCMKTARRFSSEAEWATGCSAAYKSATAHGWVAQCTSKMIKSGHQRKSA